MFRLPSLANWHRSLLLAGIAFVLLYSGLVLVRVSGSADLRVYCLFDWEVHPDGLRIDQTSDVVALNGDAPQRGDLIVSVGGMPVSGFDRYIDSIQRATRTEPTLTLTPDADPAAELVDESGEFPDRPKPWVVEHEQPEGRWSVLWVPVEYLDRSGDSTQDRRLTWLQLQPVPATTVLISLGWLLLKMVIVVIGALVAWNRPGDGTAQMFFLLCVVTVVAYIGGFHWSQLVGSRPLLYTFVVGAVLVPPITLHFYLLFPKPGQAVAKYPVPTLAAVYGPPVLWMIFLLATLLLIWWHQDEQAFVMRALGWIYTLTLSYLAVAAGLFVTGLGVLLTRFLGAATRGERNQVKWILMAALLASLPIGYVLSRTLSDPSQLAYGPTTKPAMLVAGFLFTLAYAVSITRYRLIEAGRLLNRWFLHLLVSFSAMGVFCLLLAAWTLVWAGAETSLWGLVIIVGLTVLVVLGLMGWLGDYVQRATRSHFDRDTRQLNQALRRLGDAVGELTEPARLVSQMLQLAATAVGAQKGAVFLRDEPEDDFLLAATLGGQRWPNAVPSGDELPLQLEETSQYLVPDRSAASPSPGAMQQLNAAACFGLRSHGRLAGFLVLGSKSDDMAYSEDDRQFLLAMARTTELVLQSSLAHRSINHLRQELEEKVEQIAEQRQRIVFLQGQLLSHQAAAEATEPTDAASEPGLRHAMLGSSPAVQELLSQVSRIAPSSTRVLIRGESGTGKELLARAVHENSPRAGRPFVAVHCAALSPALLESELFGHVKGAFTGADRDKPGRFELADGGTLFLDEIGDISGEVQIKLLRVLQEGTFERVGSTETRRVDVRLIAATHRDLEGLISEGAFREDLFYRLNGITLLAPPLRERADDVFELALHFLQRFAHKAGKTITQIEAEAVEALKRYRWPGNVRQLENAIERAVVLAQGPAITLADLPPELHAAERGLPTLAARRRPVVTHATPTGGAAALGSSSERVSRPRPPLNKSLQEIERDQLMNALDEAGGNKTAAAKLLGMHRSTFFSKLKKHGLT